MHLFKALTQTWYLDSVVFALPLSQVHNEDVSQERSERQRLERDLEEASRRLSMAHEDIRRLTDKLESAKKTQAMCGMRKQLYNIVFLIILYM